MVFNGAKSIGENLQLSSDAAPAANESEVILRWKTSSSKFRMTRFKLRNLTQVLTNREVIKISDELKKSKYYTVKNACCCLTTFLTFWLLVFPLTITANVILKDKIIALISFSIFVLINIIFVQVLRKSASELKSPQMKLRFLRKREIDFQRIMKKVSDEILSKKNVKVVIGQYGAWLTFKLPLEKLLATNGPRNINGEFLNFQDEVSKNFDYPSMNKSKKGGIIGTGTRWKREEIEPYCPFSQRRENEPELEMININLKD